MRNKEALETRFAIACALKEKESYRELPFEQEFAERVSFGYRASNPDAIPDVVNIHPHSLMECGNPTQIYVDRLNWGFGLLQDYQVRDVIVSGISGPPGSWDYDYAKTTGRTLALVAEEWLRESGYTGRIHRVDTGHNTFATMKAVYEEVVASEGFTHVEEVSTYEHLARIHLQGMQVNELAGKDVKRSFSGPKIRNPATALDFMLWELTSAHDTLGFTAEALKK
tara:strand:+ start:143 stop:817 length:675 start_codon:yes stop_codon:yes gene_type:complete